MDLNPNSSCIKTYYCIRIRIVKKNYIIKYIVTSIHNIILKKDLLGFRR